MILLSLDQSSRTTGYAIYTDSKLTDYGKFTFTDDVSEKRLVKLRNKIIQLIQQHNVEYIVFEDIQQQNNVFNSVQTFKVLAEVYGVVAELAEELAIPHSTLLAVSWKSILGIKGQTRPEQKKNTQEYVLNTYNVKVPQDVADAIGIGAAYIKENTCAWAT